MLYLLFILLIPTFFKITIHDIFQECFCHQFCYFHILYLMFLTEEIWLCAFIFTLYFSMPLTYILEKNISKDKFTVEVQEVPANEKREKQDIFESLFLSQLVFWCGLFPASVTLIIFLHNFKSHQITLSLLTCGLGLPCWTWFISLDYPSSPLMIVALWCC